MRHLLSNPFRVLGCARHFPRVRCALPSALVLDAFGVFVFSHIALPRHRGGEERLSNPFRVFDRNHHFLRVRGALPSALVLDAFGVFVFSHINLPRHCRGDERLSNPFRVFDRNHHFPRVRWVLPSALVLDSPLASSYSRTSIIPVTAAVMSAVRYSCKRAMASSTFAAICSIFAVSRSR